MGCAVCGNVIEIQRLDALRPLEHSAQLTTEELDLVFRKLETRETSYMLDFFSGDGHKKRV